MDKVIIRFMTFCRYNELLRQLVIRDIKLKYRRSFLGYLWSILNPLFIMLIMTLIFSKMFRFSIQNFPVYLLIARALFEFMGEATSQAMTSVVGNAPLLKKTYVPKYLFTVATVSSSAVNFIFSLGALAIVLLATKTLPSWWILLFPLTIFQLYIFTMGLSLLLAAANVFFRDMQFIYNAIITAWMYLTPIFYPVDILPGYVKLLVTQCNPMYFYIEQARCLILYGCMPRLYDIYMGCIVALISIFCGICIFKINQDKFILYI